MGGDRYDNPLFDPEDDAAEYDDDPYAEGFSLLDTDETEDDDGDD